MTPLLNKKPIFLLDTSSLIHRAYHASQIPGKPTMTALDGTPTGGTYIFNNMLKKFFAERNPDYVVACCDVPGVTWHNSVAKNIEYLRIYSKKTDTVEKIAYLGYKATRSEHPADFQAQVPWMYKLLTAYGIPICEKQKYEADDIIGTLAFRAVLAQEERSICIVTGDKDMMQLVGPRVNLYDPSKNSTMTKEDVEEKMGVKIENLIDLFALRGDSADNIPGAPGIGEKGSLELIQQFGTIENLLDNLGSVVKESHRKTLELNADVIRFSKKLFVINKVVPIHFPLQSMQRRETDNRALNEIFTALNFQARVQEDPPSPIDPLLVMDLSEDM